MASMVSVDADGAQLAGPGWRLPAVWVRRAGTISASPVGWRALVGVKSRLYLDLRWDERQMGLAVAAWTGEPDESDGVAVLATDGVPDRIAAVPLCGCGERECGNVGVQFDAGIDARQLPALIAMLRGLPWSAEIPARESALRGAPLSAWAGDAEPAGRPRRRQGRVPRQARGGRKPAGRG